MNKFYHRVKVLNFYFIKTKRKDTLFLVKEKSLLPGCTYIHKYHNFNICKYIHTYTYIGT